MKIELFSERVICLLDGTLWLLLCTDPSYWALGKEASERTASRWATCGKRKMGLTREEKRKFYLKFVFFHNIYRLCDWLNIYIYVYICVCVYIYVALGTIAKVCPYYIFLIVLYKNYKEISVIWLYISEIKT